MEQYIVECKEHGAEDSNIAVFHLPREIALEVAESIIMQYRANGDSKISLVVNANIEKSKNR